MLSPGTYYKRLPKGRIENIHERVDILKWCRDKQHAQRALIRRCSLDILYYINLFVWQFNPRKKEGSREIGPFITWDFQDEAVLKILDHIERDKDLFIEKSREMGASWLCLIVMDWMARFRSRQKFLCISHSEIAVDRKDDEDSLFWKIGFIDEMLPEWMPHCKHKKLRLTYPATRSSITGSATSARSGVGGRAAAIFLDEFSKQPNDFEILGQTADTGCRIFNGTHYGLGTAFYQLSQRPDIAKLQLHWSQHPDKKEGLYRYDPAKNKVHVLDTIFEYPENFHFIKDGSPTGGPFPGLRSPWYDAECTRRDDRRNVSMHLDIDPAGATSQVFDPLRIRNLTLEHSCEPYWRGDIVFDSVTGKRQMVETATGFLKLWIHLKPDGTPPVGTYGGGADIAWGTGATPSCLSMGNARTGEKVLEYANPYLSPDEFAKICVSLCWLFRDDNGEGAYFIWEMAGPGLKFGQAIVESGYRHFYFKTDEFDLSKEPSDKPGWYPMPKSKLMLLTEYKAALYGRTFINRSEDALKQTLAFFYKPNGMVAHPEEENTEDPTKGSINHADMAIADALCWKALKEKGRGAREKPVDQQAYLPTSLAGRRYLYENAQRATDLY